MSEEPKEQSQLETDADFEARQNLSGFFNLLLEIDMRNHPELYKKQFNENYDNNRSPNNAD